MSPTGEDRFSGLLTNSPFGPPHAEKAGFEPAQGLEFRGYVGTGPTTLFSLACEGAGGQVRSVWLELGEPEGDFVVRSFDRASESVQVDHRGRSYNLKIKLGRVQQLPPMPAQGIPTGTIDSVGDMKGKERIEALATEIRRRRAIRPSNPETTDR